MAMAYGKGEGGGGTVKRARLEIAETAGDSSYGLGGEAVNEESLLKLQKEVSELAEKAADYREKGPAAFALLLDQSLAQMRSSLPAADSHAKIPTTADGIGGDESSFDQKMLEQVATLTDRLASAKARLPEVLRELKLCKIRLDNAIKAHKQSPAETFPSIHLP